jgi:hypothetical protein
MSVKLNRPPKPEESQKDSNFNGKTIPYLGLEPRTSVGSHNHCIIWVGLPESKPDGLILKTGQFVQSGVCGVTPEWSQVCQMAVVI